MRPLKGAIIESFGPDSVHVGRLRKPAYCFKGLVTQVLWIAGQRPRLNLDLAYNLAMQDPKLVVVKSYGNSVDAELAKGALENAGIQAMIKSDTVGHMREHIAWSGAGFEIVVREEDLAAAREALSQTADGNNVPDTGSEDDHDRPPSWRRFT
jgi:Putative prokaryotic signal transducing protein